MLRPDKRACHRLWLYGLLIALILTPFLFGGVMSGDGNEMLELNYALDRSGLSFQDFIRGPQGGYAFHHILWFCITHATMKVTALFSVTRFVNQVGLSAEQIFVALAGVVLCYAFLLRRQTVGAMHSAATVLAIFVGSYGIFALSMGGTVESWMIPVMAARLFFFEGTLTPKKALGLAVVDLLLFAFKAYSVVFILALFPLFWLRASRQTRLTYLFAFGALALAFLLFKLWIWNPPPAYFEEQHFTMLDIAWRLLQQLASPWTGLPLCMPVLFALFWTPPAMRKALYFKLAALLATMLFLSFYWFFDGGIPGGRYIFPYVLVLVPEIAAAIVQLTRQHRRAIWLLPVIVTLFLPNAALSLPFFPKDKIASTGPCIQRHPALYAWTLVSARVTGQNNVWVCYLGDGYNLDIRDAATPRTAPLRVAYILSGGHSPEYLAAIHDNHEQLEHDAWAATLTARLSQLGLGSPLIWVLIGLLPAFAAIGLSLLLARRIGRQSLELPAQTQ